MSFDNPSWGAPRILSELLLLGYSVSETTVAKYMPKTRKPPSQTWRTFLANHVPDIVAIDFFTVPTLTFGVLYVVLVLRHEQRQVVHFNVTRHPTAQWTAQQIVDAFPFDEAPRFLLRDRDQIYGAYFRHRVKNMGIEEVVITPQSPWQNPYAERLIGTLRRELLDRVIVLNESHLRRLMTSYLEYYHSVRPHLSLERNAPIPRPIQGPSEGTVIAMPHVGGAPSWLSASGLIPGRLGPELGEESALPPMPSVFCRPLKRVDRVMRHVASGFWPCQARSFGSR
jgi:transposase InsO family protein